MAFSPLPFRPIYIRLQVLVPLPLHQTNSFFPSLLKFLSVILPEWVHKHKQAYEDFFLYLLN
jgi:hypothetical protein